MNALLTRTPHGAHRAGVTERTGRDVLAGGPRHSDRSYMGLHLAAGHDSEGAINRLSGLRHGRMVEIRLELSDAESATWLLCRSPRFDTVLGHGAALLPDIACAIGDVPLCMPIWQGLHLRGGEQGLVALRTEPAPMSHAFLHDLWLLERIAANLQLLAIPAGNLLHEPIPGRLS